MSIEKYTTESFVLACYERGEHDRTYTLFTRDFGLVSARATSIRTLQSKLRTHMHVGRMARVTLVKGKEIWRITGSEEIIGHTSICKEVTILLLRFVHGVGSQRRLFDHMYALVKKDGFDARIAHLLAYYLMLVDLGYADAETIGAENIEQYISWNVEDLYTQLILTKDIVRPHVMSVLSEMQL